MEVKKVIFSYMKKGTIDDEYKYWLIKTIKQILAFINDSFIEKVFKTIFVYKIKHR